MSLREFWTSVRSGASFLAPTATVDSPKLDRDRIERMLRRSDMWLTPKSVEGFDENDFQFLSHDEQLKLRDNVADFVTVAKQVLRDGPATEDQVEQALPAFRGVLQAIRPDKFGDVEAFEIGKRVEQCLDDSLPVWVTEMRFDTGEDASGDPAIWIWVEVSDNAASDPAIYSANTKQVRELVESCVRKLNTNRWPFVRFRTATEQSQHKMAGDDK